MNPIIDFLLSVAFIHMLVAIFFAILFIQSGLDKIFDWAGNLGWLKGHFAKSPLKGKETFLLGTLTFIEVLAGFFSAAGAIQIILYKNPELAYYGLLLSAVALVMLFFGQRIAKDYAGAATIVIYFVATLVGIFVLKTMTAY